MDRVSPYFKVLDEKFSQKIAKEEKPKMWSKHMSQFSTRFPNTVHTYLPATSEKLYESKWVSYPLN